MPKNVLLNENIALEKGPGNLISSTIFDIEKQKRSHLKEKDIFL